jgi:hypothetical protein
MIPKSVQRFSEISCSNKKLERDDESRKSHLARAGGFDAPAALPRGSRRNLKMPEAARGLAHCMRFCHNIVSSNLGAP